MDRRKAALNEFLEGLVSKYGSDTEKIKLIAEQINELNKKNKITVLDLDNIEKKLNQKIRSSQEYSTINSQKIPENIQTTPKPYIKNESIEKVNTEEFFNYIGRQTGKKLVSKTPDSNIFPREAPGHYDSSVVWRDYSISPYKKNTQDIDVWSKIHKADYIKYQKELEQKEVQKKIQKLQYKHLLDKQIQEKNTINQDTLINFTDQMNKQFSLPRKNYVSLKYHEEMISQKQEKLKNEIIQKKLDGINLKKQLDLESMIEKSKKIQRIKKNKELSRELLSQSQIKKLKLKDEKEMSLRRSRELLEKRINLIEFNEDYKKKFIMDKVAYAHDEQRLKILMPKNDKREVKYDGNLTSLSIGDKSYKRKPYNSYAFDLDRQVQEKKEKNFLASSMAYAEGLMTIEDDKKALEEYELSVLNLKVQQNKIREDLANQINSKYQRKINEMMFTDHEAKVNKKLFESSLNILSSSNLKFKS
jgi:hypothetical protein